MASDRWRRARDIFEAAIERPTAEREAVIAEMCGDDEELASAVRSLLEADVDAETFLEMPVAGIPGPSTATPSQASAETGPRIGPYRLLRKIGQGGMGTVHLAVRDDDAFKRRVVIKLVRQGSESPGLRRRFRTERQILASLDHPNIAALYDGGTTVDGQPYFVMEYVDGVPIDEYCDQNRLTVDQRIDLFRKVCGAVRYAHQNLVIHRDLKPSNIMVGADGEPKLLDFGIAKLLNPELASPEMEPTATWLRVLTPQYASPEQIRGKLVTTVSDVYSLGVLLYLLLCGRLPHRFAGRSPEEIERVLSESEPLRPSTALTAAPAEEDGSSTSEAIVRARADHPTALRRRIAGDLDAIVLRALRSAPQQRYGSVEQLDNDLERFRDGRPVQARRGTWRYRTGKFARRNRTGVIAAAIALAALCGFGLAMARQSEAVAHQRDQARLERDKANTVLALMLDIFKLANPYAGGGEDLRVVEALEQSALQTERRLGDQPLVRASVLRGIGQVYANLGLWQRGKRPLEEALEIRRGLASDDPLTIAESARDLALTLVEIDEEARATELANEALDMARSTRAVPKDLVKYLNAIVHVLCYRREYEQARSLAEEAFRTARSSPNVELSDVVDSTLQLGLTRVGTQRHEEAIALYEQAATLQRSRVDPRDATLAPILINLGSARRTTGDFEGAIEVLEEALIIQRDTLGERNPELAWSYSNLGSIYREVGRFEDSIASFEQARELLRPLLGDQHWRILFYTIRAQDAAIRMGPVGDAEREIRRTIEAWQAILPPDHWSLAFADSVLGESLTAQARFDEAEPLLIGAFHDLLERGTRRRAEEALRRLEHHFERRGTPEAAEPYRAQLAARNDS